MRLFSFIIIYSLLLTSCGNWYEKNVANQNKPTNIISKKEAIEKTIKNNFPKEYHYVSIAYGESKILKPKSYQTLDSLYSIKYKLQSINKRDQTLEDKITIQRAIAQSDPNPVYHFENHVFSMMKGDSTYVANANFYLNNQNKVLKFEIIETLEIPKILWNAYSNYLYEENIISPSTSNPTKNDRDFYTIYKQKANEYVGSNRDAFIVHTLQIMDIIKRNKSFAKTSILKELVKQKINETGENISSQNEFESIEELTNSDGEVLYYKVKYSYLNKSNNTVIKSFVFDTFFREVENTVL